MTLQRQIEQMRRTGYEAGFTTEIETDTVPPGLDEAVIRCISAKKDEPPTCWNGGCKPGTSGWA